MNLPEDDRVASLRGESGLPETEQAPLASDELEPELRSLRDDVEALIDDGKTYLEAEVVYQKTRAAFVADRAKGALIFGAVAALLGFLALIGLTVGLIIALIPLLTAWGASALVVMLLLLGALLAMRAASSRWNRLMGAIQDVPEKQP